MFHGQLRLCSAAWARKMERLNVLILRKFFFVPWPIPFSSPAMSAIAQEPRAAPEGWRIVLVSWLVDGVSSCIILASCPLSWLKNVEELKGKPTGKDVCFTICLTGFPCFPFNSGVAASHEGFGARRPSHSHHFRITRSPSGKIFGDR